jgi:hypothetical protein
MNRTLNKTFNKEVNRYRYSLLFYAKQCEWETFKSRAGNLFDYVESVEMNEMERKFFRIFKVILSVLFLAVFFIISVNPEAHPEMSRIKEILTIAALAGCCYELYLFISFRFYMKHKINFYKKRRERFIFDIQGDFRDIIVPSVVEQVSEAPQASAEPDQVLQNAY